MASSTLAAWGSGLVVAVVLVLVLDATTLAYDFKLQHSCRLDGFDFEWYLWYFVSWSFSPV